MQMRFDGTLGFPGGLMDEGEAPIQCLNRELHEEIGLDFTKHAFSDDERIASYLHEGKNLVLHFYLKEVSAEEFFALETNTLHAPEYGIEVFLYFYLFLDIFYFSQKDAYLKFKLERNVSIPSSNSYSRY